MVDPQWNPWLKNEHNRHQFPHFGEVHEDGNTCFINKDENHVLYYVIRQDFAIISKPGGSTPLDSLTSATPIIMLEPFGGSIESSNSINPLY